MSSTRYKNERQYSAMTKYTFEQFHEETKNTVEYHVEGLVLEFTESVAARMQAHGMTKDDLAKKAGLPVKAIEDVLRGEHDAFTLTIMVRVAMALGLSIRLIVEEGK